MKHKIESRRQGDVLIVTGMDAAVPKDAKPLPLKDGKAVLMLGEKTGHHHRFEDGEVQLLERPTGERFGIRTKPREQSKGLKHEEHGTIHWDGDFFRQGFQVEDFGEEVRPIAD